MKKKAFIFLVAFLAFAIEVISPSTNFIRVSLLSLSAARVASVGKQSQTPPHHHNQKSTAHNSKHRHAPRHSSARHSATAEVKYQFPWPSSESFFETQREDFILSGFVSLIDQPPIHS